MAEEKPKQNAKEQEKKEKPTEPRGGKVDGDTKRAEGAELKNKISSPEANQSASDARQKKDKKTKKPKKQEITVKEFAVARGSSLRISPKHCFAICKMIKGREPDRTIEMLEQVAAGKRPVPMAGREVAHQKGRGIAGAKFPKKASEEMINIVKQLKANAVVNGVENPVIVIAKADKASRPFRRAGRRAKRTHVYLEARDKSKLKKEKK